MTLKPGFHSALESEQAEFRFNTIQAYLSALALQIAFGLQIATHDSPVFKEPKIAKESMP